MREDGYGIGVASIYICDVVGLGGYLAVKTIFCIFAPKIKPTAP